MYTYGDKGLMVNHIATLKHYTLGYNRAARGSQLGFYCGSIREALGPYNRSDRVAGFYLFSF